jgi:hypothetical protein
MAKSTTEEGWEKGIIAAFGLYGANQKPEQQIKYVIKLVKTLLAHEISTAVEKEKSQIDKLVSSQRRVRRS